ncbi:MAG: hypothetical protein HQ559_11760 [Lentisphaerae bacterium]|nr:hypothetical protein [Lentisphaerota bacterium]
MMKNLTFCVACSLLIGCAAANSPESKAEWQALLGDDPKAARAALRVLDSEIKVGMTLEEVKRIFPGGALVGRNPWDDLSHVLRLRLDLHRKILTPSHSDPDYSIAFDKDGRVKYHTLIGPD